MGFWNKLGKIALQAAPYVAAPFTGGASLMATGATQKLGQKWAESDAKKAIAKGLAPSKFDRYLGLVSAGAGLASSFAPVSGAITGLSAAGKASNAAKAANAATKVSGWQDKLGKAVKVGNAVASGGSLLGGAIQIAKENDSSRGEEPTSQGLGPSNLAQPRYMGSVGRSLAAGRDQAVRNQPFRSGYQTVVQGDDNTTLTHDVPPIQDRYISPPISESAPANPTPIQNRFNDEMTPPRMRRRMPAPVEE